MKSKLTLIIICSLAMLTVLLAAPFPYYIKRTLPAVQVKGEKNVEQVSQITINGWHLNYLFRDNELKGKVLVYSKDNIMVKEYTFLGPLFELGPLDTQKKILANVIVRYDEALNIMTFGYLYGEDNWNAIAIKCDDVYYVAPAEDSEQGLAVLEYFKDLAYMEGTVDS